MTIRIRDDRPFVGFISAQNEIEVVERAGDLVCKSRRNVVLFKQIIVFLFGGAITAGVWFSVTHPAIAPTPLFWLAFMTILAVICWLIFLRNVLGTPFFEVSGGTGDILLFRRRTRAPWKRIPAAEVSQFTIEKRLYGDDELQVENAVLILVTASGERRVLCASPDAALIKTLAEKLEGLTRRKV